MATPIPWLTIEPNAADAPPIATAPITPPTPPPSAPAKPPAANSDLIPPIRLSLGVIAAAAAPADTTVTAIAITASKIAPNTPHLLPRFGGAAAVGLVSPIALAGS